VSFVKPSIIAAFAVLLLCAPSSGLAAAPKNAPAPPTTTSATTTSADEPTSGESAVAVLAILSGVAVAFGVIVLVGRAHDLQARLAAATVARGGSVDTATTSAAGGDEIAAAEPDTIAITGPDEVAVDPAGEFKVEKTVAHPTWSVSGLGSFTQLLKNDDHTFVFTPREEKADVKIKVTAGQKTGEKPVKILAAAKSSFTVRYAVRNLGLVVVAVAIVFGAIALGVTGHLDGGNFVALVAPLAALLGVTAAVTERGGGGGGGGASAGSSGVGSSGS
jgi:hypothetical protein